MSSFSDTQTALGVSIAAKVPVVLWGPPGQGKTATINAIAQERGMHLETVLASVREPSDFAGLPYIVDGATKLIAPDWAQRIAAADANGQHSMLFLDEVSTAPPAVQAALLRVAQERVAGDHYLGDNVAIVAAANPPDMAANGWDLSDPMANRFLHLEWSLPADVVRDGFTLGWPSVNIPTVDPAAAQPHVTSVMAMMGYFIQARPDLVTVMPKVMSSETLAYPTPRSWEIAARLVGTAKAAGAPPATERMLLVGTVGQAAAVEYVAYVADLDLPNPEDVLADPRGFDVPARGDRVYAVASSVLASVMENNTDDRWIACGGVLERVAAANHADIAVAVGRRWMANRPNAKVRPNTRTLRALAPILRKAGILPRGQGT